MPSLSARIRVVAHKCVWASKRPGRTLDVDKSMTVALDGICRDAPIALIVLPSIRIVWLVAIVPATGSTSRPALIAVVVGAWATSDPVTIRATAATVNDCATPLIGRKVKKGNGPRASADRYRTRLPSDFWIRENHDAGHHCRQVIVQAPLLREGEGIAR